MQQPRPVRAPTFYLTGRQPLRPGTILLAVVAVVGALSPVLLIRGHPGHSRRSYNASGASRAADSAANDDKDDPSQVDTIVLGDPADAPVPARKGDRAGGRSSNVHATILIRLPRYGEGVGLIPDSPAGHLLYSWLAAFNQASYSALGNVLPTAASASTAAAQLQLRRQTGGYNLLSAREIQPGVLAFRLRDQTPDGNEVLGTLQMLPGSSPPAIATFSLSDIPASSRHPAESTAPPSGVASH